MAGDETDVTNDVGRVHEGNGCDSSEFQQEVSMFWETEFRRRSVASADGDNFQMIASQLFQGGVDELSNSTTVREEDKNEGDARSVYIEREHTGIKTSPDFSLKPSCAAAGTPKKTTDSVHQAAIEAKQRSRNPDCAFEITRSIGSSATKVNDVDLTSCASFESRLRVDQAEETARLTEDQLRVKEGSSTLPGCRHIGDLSVPAAVANNVEVESLSATMDAATKSSTLITSTSQLARQKSSESTTRHRLHQQADGHQPGAFPVDGINRRGRTTQHQRQTSPYTSPTPSPTGRSPSNAVAAATVRRDSPSFLHPVSAVLVGEEEDANDLTQRERDIYEKEKWLKQQLAKLSAWEQELEQKQQQLEQTHDKVVQAYVLEDGHKQPIRKKNSFLTSLKRRTSKDKKDGLLGRISGHGSSELVYKDMADVATTSAEIEQVDVPESVDMEYHLIEAELGSGPTRFAQKTYRTVEQQVAALSPSDRRCYNNLKQRWEDRRLKGSQNWFPYSDEMILRFARNTARKSTGFYEDRAYKAMKKFRQRYATLSIHHRLDEQVMSKTLFPVPGLKSNVGHDMFYMRPSRYHPKHTKTQTIIDNLAYVMNCMLEKEANCTKGIGFLACMDDWKMKNFDADYCYQFMMTLQGYVVPVRVQLFLIVNPPSWFGVIWKIMKPMLVKSFRKKVKMIQESELPNYLQEGYENFLPDDMETGMAHTEGMIQDFVTYRKHAEKRLSVQHPDGMIADGSTIESENRSTSDQVSSSQLSSSDVSLNDLEHLPSSPPRRPTTHQHSHDPQLQASTMTAMSSLANSSSRDSDEISCHVWTDDEYSLSSEEGDEDFRVDMT